MSLRPIAGAGARSTANAPCRKHPNHRQSPGVCSVCLTEKLVILSSDRGSKPVRSPPSSNSSASSYVSSLSSSSCASPPLAVARVYKRSIAANNLLTKSRSVATFAPRRRREEEDEDSAGKKAARRSKRGFWSKWLVMRSKGKNLTHSKTMNDRTIRALG
ncbi:uncharacterized protein LOC127258228 [Andrographis paniculata]|uniref:uncharacterized protein LOC127258228 n=1 Tax=Andrographis paniculata TaxID=175694 RepID=UPI0021E8DDE2|nr:uncharacterized protein LOC127258228 [Andrographis paniculata]